MLTRRPTVYRRHNRGFSLVEVAIALGIIGFSLVAIIGVVPVAIDSSVVSRSETSATFIAQSIIETLKSGPTDTGIVQIKPFSDPGQVRPDDFSSIDLKKLSEQHVLYLGYGQDCSTIAEITSSEYSLGSGRIPDIIYIAKLTITPQPNSTAHVEVSVETPAGGMEINRNKFTFNTCIAP